MCSGSPLVAMCTFLTSYILWGPYPGPSYLLHMQQHIWVGDTGIKLMLMFQTHNVLIFLHGFLLTVLHRNTSEGEFWFTEYIRMRSAHIIPCDSTATTLADPYHNINIIRISWVVTRLGAVTSNRWALVNTYLYSIMSDTLILVFWSWRGRLLDTAKSFLL